MKRRVFGMLLSLCLVLALIPAAAFAEDAVKTFTLEAPYTTKVEQGGSAKPGKTVFKLEVVSFDGKELELDGVTVSGSTITTDGVGDYNNKLTFTFSDESFYKISDGVFVQQVNEGADGWTYDPTVWYLWPHIAGASCRMMRYRSWCQAHTSCPSSRRIKRERNTIMIGMLPR